MRVLAPVPHLILENLHEKNVPAEQDQTQENAWFFGPDADEERPGGAAPPSRQGAQEIGRLVWPKSRHLLKRSEFVACYERGARRYTKSFVLFVLDREKDCTDRAGDGAEPGAEPGFTPARVGLTVGRKVGNAVARNRLKRVLREFFRLHQEQLEDGIDIVVVPKRTVEARRLSLGDVEKELSSVLPRLRRPGAVAGSAGVDGQ